jgi:hypothetical protein
MWVPSFFFVGQVQNLGGANISGAVSVTSGLTVDSGGVSVVSGGSTVSGGLVVLTGGLTVATNGALTVCLFLLAFYYVGDFPSF